MVRASSKVFAWQGFQLQTPEDWETVAVAGNREEGYARLASPGALACQIRWKRAKGKADLRFRLTQYLDRLSTDSKKSRTRFTREIEDAEDGLLYRYAGSTFGRGRLFLAEETQTVFFLEVTSSKKDSLLSPFRDLLASFEVQPAEAEQERWALLGLDVRLPRGLKVERQEFRAGRTRLTLRGTGYEVVAERWGFAEQLIERHGLDDWARAALDMPGAKAETEANRARLVRRGHLLRPHAEALLHVDPVQNQIVAVRVRGRRALPEVRWDWLIP